MQNESPVVPSQLMEKLQKLLALRDGTDNPNEAANASARISDLLTKYNLDISDIKSPKDKPKVILSAINLNLFQSKTDGDYARNLFIILANSFYCQPIIMKYSINPRVKYDQNDVHIIGREDNVATVRYTGEQLLARLDRMESIAWKEEQHSTTLNRNPFKRAYLRGAVRGIEQTLMEQRRREQTQYAQSITALVVCVKQEIQNYMDQNYNKGQLKDKNTQGKKLMGGDSEAYGRGFNEGRQMSIQKGIESPMHRQEIGN